MTPDLLDADKLRTLTISDVAKALDDKEFTVVTLIQSHLASIAKWNQVVKAVVEVNPAALQVAEVLDRELESGSRRSLLHGVPVLIKDNVASQEFGATAGFLGLIGAMPSRENVAVTWLREAGAVILGATNLSEWANFRSRDWGDNGWSPRGGQTYGTYHKKMDPCGSSSGSGVGLDLGMCMLAIGSETWGSIIRPADKSNVVGIKPTVGLVSRNAVIPISPFQDTIGPMARTVYDAAAMLTVMAGADHDDEDTGNYPFDQVPDYASYAAPHDISELRVGIPRNAFADVPDDIVSAFNDFLPQLAASGLNLIDIEFPCEGRFRELEEADESGMNLAPAFHIALNQYLSTLTVNPNGITDLNSVIQFTKQEPAEQYSQRDIFWLELSAGLDYNSPEHIDGLKDTEIFAGEQGIGGALKKHRLDAILAPSVAMLPNMCVARGRMPVISVPLGYLPPESEVKFNNSGRLVEYGPNVPFGISILGDRFSEPTLIRIAFAIEQMTQTRSRAPEHRLTVFQTE